MWLLYWGPIGGPSLRYTIHVLTWIACIEHSGKGETVSSSIILPSSVWHNAISQMKLTSAVRSEILWPPCSRKTRTHRSFPLAAEKCSSVQPLASRILGEYPCSSILLTVQTSPAATAAWICSSSWSSGFLLQWWFSILSHFRTRALICVWGEVKRHLLKTCVVITLTTVTEAQLVDRFFRDWSSAIDDQRLPHIVSTRREAFQSLPQIKNKLQAAKSNQRRSQIPIMTSSILLKSLEKMQNQPIIRRHESDEGTCDLHVISVLPF